MENCRPAWEVEYLTIVQLPTETQDTFTSDEVDALRPYFTNTDRPVFALINLPETVKGAMFARYSRSAKSLRRLFLDEFRGDVPAGAEMAQPTGTDRADRLYARVLNEYGDDSVAQLGSAHVACEGVSNILTKVLEWGRLMAYLEQSTRYVPYTDRPNGRWKYHVPAEVAGTPLASEFARTMDYAFEVYARWIPAMEAHFRAKYPKAASDSDGVYRSVIRAKALDTLRGLLPAATTSNVGLFGTGQAFEALLLRMFAHPLEEVRAHATLMLTELRKVIPAFLTRVDVAERGRAWTAYWRETRETVHDVTAKALTGIDPEPRPEVTLTDWDPDGEVKVIAAALYAQSDLPDDQLLAVARELTPEQRAEVLGATVGDRANRRHKPGRAWERTDYRFDVCCDFGAFRDLQRHRPLTIEWQRLTTEHGFDTPAAIDEAGLRGEWDRAMEASAAMERDLRDAGMGEAAQYAVAMAYRIRFVMQMNAREAMHLTELRSQPQGHPTYRRVAQEMHRLIVNVHPTLGAAFTYLSHEDVDLERLEAERRTEVKRNALGQA